MMTSHSTRPRPRWAHAAAVAALAVGLLGSGVASAAPGTGGPAAVGAPTSGAAATTAPTTGPDSLSVTRLYQAFFLRTPDAGGLAHWHAHVRSGYPLSAVASDFAKSPEFVHRYGSLDDGAFVDLVYRNVLSRSPDAGGRAHWTGTLAQGLLTRGGVMLSFSDSAEYKARTGLVGTTTQVEVTRRSPGQVDLVVTDPSGRNVSRVAPTLPERRIHVRVSYPVDGNGRPRTTALPVHVVGTYRAGPTPLCGPRTGELIHACVGFPMMDQQTGVNWGDIPNHPADVGVVLDHLIGDPGLAGAVDVERIVFSGASMGGITGLYLASEQARDPRIRAVASTVGFAPFGVPQLAVPGSWAPEPDVLMVNAHDDPSIPYELARHTVESAGADRIELVTVRSGGHNPQCAAASAYTGAWLDHHLFGAPRPATASLTGCAAPGLLPGGTTGLGLASGFAP